MLVAFESGHQRAGEEGRVAFIVDEVTVLVDWYEWYDIFRYG